MEKKERLTGREDDFWDLSDLVPRRKPAARSASDHDAEAVEITVHHGTPIHGTPPHGTPIHGTPTHGSPSHAETADVPLTERPVFPHRHDEAEHKPHPEATYTPENSLLRAVRIYPWKSEYTYYEQFRRHAEALVDREGKECPEADFFSYMPQYTQLNREQLNYYLWWRTNFRRGVCLPAAYSYLLLYLYELINLDEKHLSPQTGQENMYRLWLSYREKHPRLDVLVREWLCDYSLLYRLPPPKMDAAHYRLLLSGCRLKEFYVSSEGDGDALCHAILLFCNNYDYTKSKFYRPDTKADYDRVLGGAIGVALAHLRAQSGDALTDQSGVSTVTRDTFAGAVCSWRLKRRIEVDFTSFSHTHELRYIMTDVLKYAENALRAVLGVKSRLTVYAVSVPLRAELDAYLATALPKRQPRATSSRVVEIPDYERRYDLPSVGVSAERAAAIEADSWQTTRRLVEAFGGADPEITPETGAKNGKISPLVTSREEACAPPDSAAAPSPSLPQTTAAPAFGREPAACGGASWPPPAGVTKTVGEPPCRSDSPLAAALGDLAAFLPLALAGDRGAQRAFAAAHGLMPDAIADKINTVAGDILGDILLEEQNGAYTVIEDYLDFLYDEGVLEHGKS